jgi:GNAT superfamily N-acetyltransferase
MVEVRSAVADDARELVRLRVVMFGSVDGCEPAPGRWQQIAEATLRKRLADPDGSLAAFVVDRPEELGTLAACAVGVIECRLGDPDNPTGQIGYVFNVATDREYRRRGYSRACMEALLGWFQWRGVTQVDLRASDEGEPLYRTLGFARTYSPAMRRKVSPGQPE